VALFARTAQPIQKIRGIKDFSGRPILLPHLSVLIIDIANNQYPQ